MGTPSDRVALGEPEPLPEARQISQPGATSLRLTGLWVDLRRPRSGARRPHGERYHRLLGSLDELVASPPLTERAAAAAGKALPRLVARSYAGVRHLVEEAAAKPEGAEREELLHDARKAAKAARYAGESVSRVFGADATTFAQAMEAVQEALGEYQDSVLIRERLRDLALTTSSTGAAFLYGRLHALEEARAQQSQQRFDDAWKAAGRKGLHRWLR